MALFKRTTNLWKMSEAAVVVQNLLELQTAYELDRPAKELANYLVGFAWGKHEIVLDGRRGVRPNKLALAAVALTEGMEAFELDASKRDTWLAIIRSLETLLVEVGQHGALYPFQEIDRRLIAFAAEKFEEKFNQVMSRLVDK